MKMDFVSNHTASHCFIFTELYGWPEEVTPELQLCDSQIQDNSAEEQFVKESPNSSFTLKEMYDCVGKKDR